MASHAEAGAVGTFPAGPELSDVRIRRVIFIAQWLDLASWVFFKV